MVITHRKTLFIWQIREDIRERVLVLLYFTITKFSFATDLPDGDIIVQECFDETY